MIFDAYYYIMSFLQPIFVRVDSRKSFEWRVRNLPYSIDNYDVTVDQESQSIVIRTNNKK